MLSVKVSRVSRVRRKDVPIFQTIRINTVIMINIWTEIPVDSNCQKMRSLGLMTLQLMRVICIKMVCKFGLVLKKIIVVIMCPVQTVSTLRTHYLTVQLFKIQSPKGYFVQLFRRSHLP